MFIQILTKYSQKFLGRNFFHNWTNINFNKKIKVCRTFDKKIFQHSDKKIIHIFFKYGENSVNFNQNHKKGSKIWTLNLIKSFVLNFVCPKFETKFVCKKIVNFLT